MALSAQGLAPWGKRNRSGTAAKKHERADSAHQSQNNGGRFGHGCESKVIEINMLIRVALRSDGD
jgi:hypothetical protein